jgi:hypothetical protein
MRSRSLAALVAVALFVVIGCAAVAPTPAPNAVVHFRNLSGSALLVGVSTGDDQSKAVLRACGGEASIPVLPPPPDDPRIQMGALYDSTGTFDELVADQPAGSIDPDILGNMQMTAMIWSRGDIGIDELPRWVTFHSGTTDVAGAAPTETAPPRCDPWPPSE